LLHARVPRADGVEAAAGAAQDRGLLRGGARARHPRGGGGALPRARRRVHERQHPRGAEPGASAARRARAPVMARVEGLGPSSIQEINALPREVAEALYARLIPAELLAQFRVDPVSLRGPDGARLVQITAPEDKPWARVEVRASTDDRDPAL